MTTATITRGIVIFEAITKNGDSAGWGFIRPKHWDKDLFFNFRDVLNKSNDTVLKKGQPVEFEIGQNEKGPCARNIRLVE